MSYGEAEARRPGARRPCGRRRNAAVARACRLARSEALENRLLLSANPADNITSTVDHSMGFGSTFDLRFNGTAGLPKTNNVVDPNTGNILYSNVLELTDAKNGEVSTAFTDPAPDGTAEVLGIDTFDTTFDFTYGTTTAPGADGFTFTLQNAPAKSMALGFPGGSLGYQSIANSIAIKFDIYPNLSTTGLYLDGAFPGDTPVQAVNAATPAPANTSIDLTKNPDGSPTGIDFHANFSDDFRCHLVYNGTTLTETVSDVTKNVSVTQKYTANVPAAINGHTAYAGFTAATGGLNAEQDIISWVYNGVQTSTGVVPLPAPTLYATACQSGSTLLTWSGGTGNETGFEIDRSTDGTTFTMVNSVGTGTSSFMDSGLDPTRTYTYRIKALGDSITAGDSPFSNTAAASAAGLNPPTAINHPSGFAGATDVKTNGTARILPASASVPNALQLTSGLADGESGSAFDTNAQLVNQFNTSFDFSFGTTTPPNADGFTFTIEAGPPDIRGGSGGGLGYVNIANSIAVKFDVYDDAAGPVASTTGLYVNGAPPGDSPGQPIDPVNTAMPGNSVDLTTNAQGVSTGINFHTNPTDDYRVHLVYDGTTLTETLTDVTKSISVTQAYTIDIPGTIATPCAYVGFTGGTGGQHAEQDITKWTFTSGNAQLRLPADFNSDGTINFADLLILAQNYGSTHATFAQGDASGDGTVNFADLLILAQNYGQSASATDASGLLRPLKRRH